MDYFRIILIVSATLLGAGMGSFACCQAWRIRLKEEKKEDPGKRSVCLSCGKQLRWFENIPILSWVLQKGKCRKCGKKIGYAEILAEVLGAVSFGLITWRFVSVVPSSVTGLTEFLAEFDIPRLATALAAMVGLILLAVYDGKWREMPVGILLYTIIMGVVYACIMTYRVGLTQVLNTCPEGMMCAAVVGTHEAFVLSEASGALLSLLGSVALLAGVYYLLYLFSKEKLVGGGDWMLCLAIGLLLADWRLALLELFLSNFLGSLVMLGFKKKKAAFGPFLVVAFVLIFAFSDVLLKTLAMNL